MMSERTTASKELKGMSAVVTGAGSGLGRSVAIGIAGAGANVAVFDINKEEAVQTCEIIKEEMPDISAVEVLCDVTNEADVEKAFAIINDCFGSLNIMVNVAGVAPAGALVDLSADKWRFALEAGYPAQ